MIHSSLDILYLSLAIGFVVLVIFLSITLLYATFVLRDVSKITEKVRDAVDKINHVIISPVKMLQTIFENLKPFVDNLREKSSKIRGRKRSGDQNE